MGGTSILYITGESDLSGYVIGGAGGFDVFYYSKSDIFVGGLFIFYIIHLFTYPGAYIQMTLNILSYKVCVWLLPML